MSGALAGPVLQASVETAAVVSGVLVFLVSFLVGTVAIALGAQVLVDRDTGFRRAAVTALIGALVYALVGVFLGWIPLLGPVLMLLAWVAVINWQYPGGWGTALGIAFLAWLVAVLILYGLALLGIATDAFGIPGV
ncbi:hypothetical protein NDI56_11550 [Haloarcula sp. S1CR25-12]|uniref:Tripartite tricarboxylate transporter TctB family protein n=1 Tax=Haloarcula saliterrae TaxID=2950534 RepID=A0ABU2FCP9_9EURY|nr:hypothetical protein [Haloarcula sp. S1CR25-12]MDS0260029.1 hypothetical protein [Haloarcula sp. S1CR25-12]